MREVIFDLIVFATGLSLGVVLSAYLFERKRKELIEVVDREMDVAFNRGLSSKGIMRTEYDALAGQVCLIMKTITEHGKLLERDRLTTPKPD